MCYTHYTPGNHTFFLMKIKYQPIITNNEILIVIQNNTILIFRFSNKSNKLHLSKLALINLSNHPQISCNEKNNNYINFILFTVKITSTKKEKL